MPESVRVLLFARYAELLGADRLELPVAARTTVDQLVQRVRALPGGAALPSQLLCAVNLRQAAASDLVAPGDELALLPPLAGG